MDKAAIICQVHRGAQAPEADMRPTRGVPRLITSLVAPDNSIYTSKVSGGGCPWVVSKDLSGVRWGVFEVSGSVFLASRASFAREPAKAFLSPRRHALGWPGSSAF